MGSTAPETKSPPKRFTKAQSIGGRKMVLKSTGKVIEVEKKVKEKPIAKSDDNLPQLWPTGTTASGKQPALSQAERELMDNLLSITDAIDVTIPTPTIDNSVNLQNQQLADIDLLPDQNVMDIGGDWSLDVGKDWSLDDIF